MRRYFVAVGVVALCGAALYGQSASPSISSAVKASYNEIKGNFIRAAEKMPDEDYSFQPTKEVRTFGAWVAHIADFQMSNCSKIAGTPKKGNAASMTSKADLVAALKQSFDECDAVYNGLTDANAMDAISFTLPFVKGPQQARVFALEQNISHDNEAYGAIAVYMRLKGLVPPSSEPRPK